MQTELKEDLYKETLERILALTEGETDRITIMSTVICELHNSFDSFHWTGFYRVTEPEILKAGPYQGGHGCLIIPFSKGVCGKAATEQKTQLVEDVNELPFHIACSATTQSEIVVPVFQNDELIAVLDIDSDNPSEFDKVDQKWLERVCSEVNWGC